MNADDIDFASLPNKFVIKPNNGCYDTVIVTDKESCDLEAVRTKMAESMKHTFGYDTAEPHYTKISPCIIAEDLIESDGSAGLVDYKIWCFDGKPYCFLVCANRDNSTHKADLNYYDLNWTPCKDKMSTSFQNDFYCPQPKNLKTMLDYAEKISAGLPQVRVDFYNIRGKIYFGEMTLTTCMGMIPYYTKETLIELGDKCVLPHRSLSVRLKCFFKRILPQ